ncbi:DgyrCDS4491 [Dimorphilus gyrociliatus]|uniref:DgyrCDS4491 n=1 Tax=Dimorphilus gyrociliatus TaxID=2664684 RepID=A0A7I8VIK8_9ANNE|nr:DgyrCDS4491 [Dimorphilus gyrociliatus]
MNKFLWSIFIYAVVEISSLESATRPLKIQLDIVPHPAVIKGGAKRIIIIEAFEGSGLCRIESSEVNEVRFHGVTENFHISEPNKKVHRILVEAFDNGIASQKETFEILVICKEIGTDIIRTAQKEILIYESFDTFVSGDPHFVQTVFDEANKDRKLICYDVTGEAGDHIEILTQNSSKTIIKGELIDDNYMHLIKITYLDGNIISSTEGTKFSDGLFIDWSNRIEPQKIERDTHSIIYNGPSITIELKNMDDSIQNLNFTIKRLYHTLTGYFLDINFNHLVNYEGLGGLLGRIGNNKFVFFGTAEEAEDDTDSSKIAVNVNGQTMLSALQRGCSSQLLDIHIARPDPPILKRDGFGLSITVEALQGKGICRAKVSHPSEVILKGCIDKFPISRNGLVNNIIVEAVDSYKLERDKIITVHIECFDEVVRAYKTESVHFILQNKYPLSGGSQHFKQVVKDEKDKSLKMICYDINGREGDQILIIKLQDLDISIYGELMNEYFMKAIKVISPHGNITSDRTGTLSEDGFSMNLNAFYPTYEGIDGLLGRIGNNLFKFYKTVQEAKGRKAIISVNGNLSLTSVRHNISNCWYMEVNDALFPYRISHYLSSNV